MEQERANNLVKRIIMGDEAAEKELYNSFKDEIEFFIKSKIGKSNPDWRDLHQEIFVAIFQRIREKQYDSSKGTLGAFLHSTIKFKIMDYKKSSRYRRRNDFEDIAENKITNGSGSLADQYEKKEERQLLKSVIGKLKEPYKKIIYLFIYQELKVKEIAKNLNISEEKVSNLKSYALTLIRKEIKKLKISK